MKSNLDTYEQIYKEIHKIVPKQNAKAKFFTKQDILNTLKYLNISETQIEEAKLDGIKTLELLPTFIPGWTPQETVGSHPIKVNLINLLAHLNVKKLEKNRLAKDNKKKKESKILKGKRVKRKAKEAKEDKEFKLSIYNFLQQANLPFERYIKSISIDKESKSITLVFK